MTVVARTSGDLVIPPQQHDAQAIASPQRINIVAHIADGDELREVRQRRALDRVEQDLPTPGDDQQRQKIDAGGKQQEREADRAQARQELLGLQAAERKKQKAGADGHAGEETEATLFQWNPALVDSHDSTDSGKHTRI